MFVLLVALIEFVGSDFYFYFFALLCRLTLVTAFSRSLPVGYGLAGMIYVYCFIVEHNRLR